MNILLLQRFAREAHQRLAGATLETPTWYRPVLVVPCRVGRRRLYLVAVLEAPGPFVHLTTERPLEGARAPERFSVLAGRRIEGVTATARDRVLQIDVDAPPSGATEPMSLRLHLYGAQASVQLRRAGSTLESVGGRRRPESRPRRATLVDIDAEGLKSTLAGTGDDTVVPGLEKPLADAFGGVPGLDAAALLAFRDAVLGATVPFALAMPKRRANAVPVPTGTPGAEGSFQSADAATRAVGDDVLAATKRRMVTSLARPVKKYLDSQIRLLENLGHDLERARGHERIRREAETLSAYRSRVRPGSAAVELPDVYDPGATVHITLDPAAGVQSQIEKRFRKAAKLEKSETHTHRRIELVEREIQELRAALTVLDRSESFARALLHLEAIRSRFDIVAGGGGGGGRRSPERTAVPFRRYDLAEGWFALVGKSSRDNDELTFRHAAPDDLWMHAQSVPGSHVVLKSPGPPTPPPHVLEMAASIAAHYSRARHSALVPVIYTRRKYVRKFRGAAAGQVRCEREKTVMVPPALPSSTDGADTT
jgi:predicted ribosome quality control (RQC) complex YloA/Tae2 family protein